jgi:hypothetical protein
MTRIFPFVFVGLLSLPLTAHAQAPATTTTPPRQVVSMNPFGLIVGWFNAEYERAFAPSATWGISGSMFDFDDFEYRNANALMRFYPQENAPRGFFIGGRAGVYRVAHDDADDDDDATFGGAGFELGYTWLLGPRQRVAISLGAGASRLFGADLDGAPLVIPTVRLVNVGVAF